MLSSMLNDSILLEKMLVSNLVFIIIIICFSHLDPLLLQHHLLRRELGHKLLDLLLPLDLLLRHLLVLRALEIQQ